MSRRTVKKQIVELEEQLRRQPEQRRQLAAKHAELLERVCTPDEMQTRVIRPLEFVPAFSADPPERTEAEAAAIAERVQRDRERIAADVRRVVIDDERIAA